MITTENIEKDLKMGKLQNLYLLYGEELFLLENSLKKIKLLFGECIKGINYINIDDTNCNNLISDIETPSFGYEKKLIIARNTGLFQKEGKRKVSDIQKLREKVTDYIKDSFNLLNKSVVLVFVEENVDCKQELYKVIDKLGIVCRFDFEKPFQIEKRIMGICKAYNVSIDKETVKYFIECCGGSMQDLINEIRKLIEYAGNGGKILKEDIDKLSIKKMESIIFDLTDSLGKKNIEKSLEVLKNLIYAKEPIQKILITLYNHFRKLYFVKIALRNNNDIINTLKLKSNQVFLVNKYKMQAKYFKENDLKEILNKIMDLDYKYKSGEIDLQVGLEAILCKYCS